jgi:hypothetical protein
LLPARPHRPPRTNRTKSVFPNAKVEAVSDFMASFELEGQRFNALNGDPKYRFNEAVSFFISVETQNEVDISEQAHRRRCRGGHLRLAQVEGYGLAEVVIESEERPDRSHGSLRGVSPRTHQTAATRQFGAVFLRLFWGWPLADAARGRPVPRIRKGSK